MVVPALVLALSAAVAPPVAAGPETQERLTVETVDLGRPVLTEDVVGDGRAIRRWPGKRITFSDKLSPSYDWAIDNAVKAWNKGSGVKMKLVRAPQGQRGDVIVKRGATSGSAGQATIGRAPNAYVHLATGYPKKLPREDWITTSVLLAHEFGHVLGVNHLFSDDPQVELLMEPYIPNEGALGDGRMSCRWVTKRDAKAAIKLYGGRVDLAPKLCDVEPYAPALKNVVVDGGFVEGTPVTLTWDLPAGIPPQSQIIVEVAQTQDCETNNSVDGEVLPPSATSWTDPAGWHEFGAYCYRLSLVNYWGGGTTYRFNDL